MWWVFLAALSLNFRVCYISTTHAVLLSTTVQHRAVILLLLQEFCLERVYYPIWSKVVVLQNSCHPNDVFVHFYCFQPSTLLCVFNQLLTRRKLAIPSKYRSTVLHAQVTKHFYEHFSQFCSRKSRFTTKFDWCMLFKNFFHNNL